MDIGCGSGTLLAALLDRFREIGKVKDVDEILLDVSYRCVDAFLMCETVSLLTQPKGIRTEYHMLRHQWYDLIRQALGTRFGCLSESTCYSDKHLELFTMHFGKLLSS
ncbi:MAG: hypothetical protein JW882_06960 [Deltaproteobacteria bacterium]|nr:hypothetical protein [Deltaproteobacteria bacterium]